MPIYCESEEEVSPYQRNPDGTLIHVYCEGSRRHVMYYDSFGAHCMEKECEMNKPQSVGLVGAGEE